MQQFDIVVANPPYSISQWNRDAFSADKYGRNFLGVPPQGRADDAFFQHILVSMRQNTGRCAILFPHGVLFRDEERDMREKLIRSDLLECVIGLGPNLFYNASMEACIVICRTKKAEDRKGQVLLINAVNEVTRKNAQSYLEDRHIKRIADAYEKFQSDGEIAKKVSIRDIEKNNFSLNLTLYIPVDLGVKDSDDRDTQSRYEEWVEASATARGECDALTRMLEGGEDDG